MRFYRAGAFLAAAVFAVSLAGCTLQAQSGTQGTQQESSAQESGGQTAQNAISSLFDRTQSGTEEETPETVELQVMREGETETVTATVYTGSGYTIAIPEDWEREDNEPQWSPRANDDVKLTVRYYTEQQADAAAEQFAKEEDEYTFEAAQTESLSNVSDVTVLRGSKLDGEEQEELAVYFINSGEDCYALILECPTEAVEGFGAYLGAMANSFALTETQTAGTANTAAGS